MIIPREALFGNPERARAQVSPDGRWAAFLAPIEDTLNVWVAPIDRLSNARAVTAAQESDILTFHWTWDSRDILYLSDQLGDENWRVFRTSAAGGDTALLTPQSHVHARIACLSPQRPREVLLGLNSRDPRVHDFWIANLDTGDSTETFRNEAGFTRILADTLYRPCVAEKRTPAGDIEVFRHTPAGGWQILLILPNEDAIASQVLDIDAEGRTLYLLDSRGRDTAALCAVNIQHGHSETLFEDSRSDVRSVLWDPRQRTPQAVERHYLHPEWVGLDPTTGNLLRELSGGEAKSLCIGSRAADDSVWSVEVESDQAPRSYFLFRPRERSVEPWFSSRPALARYPMKPMSAHEITSRDGLTLTAYLTRPDAGAAAPLVVWVHGGPWSRVTWGYNPLHQWLAGRGYAALSVNYRGSTGFGKRFVNAGDFEWAGKIHTDLLDSVDWAQREGIATDKVAIMGHSFGGYAALMALALAGERFQCGIDLSGPSSLLTLLQSAPSYWGPDMALFTRRIGNPETPEGRESLLSQSPVRRLHQIRKPLLIAHGAHDPRAKKEEADRVADALSRQGTPFLYALFPHEGHTFIRAASRIAFFAVAEAFLAPYLGGAVEPPGDEVIASGMALFGNLSPRAFESSPWCGLSDGAP